MLQEAPASIIAGMLGYQQTSAENIAAAASTHWQRYAASGCWQMDTAAALTVYARRGET
jgi:hypothetical protein